MGNYSCTNLVYYKPYADINDLEKTKVDLDIITIKDIKYICHRSFYFKSLINSSYEPEKILSLFNFDIEAFNLNIPGYNWYIYTIINNKESEAVPFKMPERSIAIKIIEHNKKREQINEMKNKIDREFGPFIPDTLEELTQVIEELTKLRNEMICGDFDKL